MLPTGDLADEDDDSGLLEVVYPGGHRIVANAHSFFAMAVAEGAQLEVATRPDDLGIKERNLTPAQKRTAELLEHLQRKHTLE